MLFFFVFVREKADQALWVSDLTLPKDASSPFTTLTGNGRPCIGIFRQWIATRTGHTAGPGCAAAKLDSAASTTHKNVRIQHTVGSKPGRTVVVPGRTKDGRISTPHSGLWHLAMLMQNRTVQLALASISTQRSAMNTRSPKGPARLRPAPTGVSFGTGTLQGPEPMLPLQRVSPCITHIPDSTPSWLQFPLF